ncbi:MAG TPA: hypothetical protein VD906_07760 [Caulobacteraceae bacterium]|nr:hypothetical protein [Caulobacteraceae bacterium]
MTPTVPQLLLGNFMSMIEPPPPEAMGEFMTGKVAVTAMISLLAAQEAERGIEARLWENSAIRAVLSRSWLDYGERFRDASKGHDSDFTLAKLDAANATLRRELIALHELAESRGDTTLHREIIALYVKMAEARRLDLPPLPGS